MERDLILISGKSILHVSCMLYVKGPPSVYGYIVLYPSTRTHQCHDDADSYFSQMLTNLFLF